MTHEQEQLVIQHMRIVPAIAKRLVKTMALPFWIAFDEMVSCGYVGLCTAALRYNPALGKFETYATFKIRGAIIDDFLRKQPPVAFAMGDGLLEDEEAQQAHTEPIDPSPSIEEVLIEQGEQRRKCRHLAFAGLSVGAVELRAVTGKHAQGKTLKQIGAEEGRSASWAHYRVHCGERQLREALLETCAE